MVLEYYSKKPFAQIKRIADYDGLKIVIASSLFVGENCLFVERFTERKYKKQNRLKSYAFNYEEFAKNVEAGVYRDVNSIVFNSFYNCDNCDIYKIAKEFVKQGISVKISFKQPYSTDKLEQTAIEKI